jgi:hypothetical protein
MSSLAHDDDDADKKIPCSSPLTSEPQRQDETSRLLDEAAAAAQRLERVSSEAASGQPFQTIIRRPVTLRLAETPASREHGSDEMTIWAPLNPEPLLPPPQEERGLPGLGLIAGAVGVAAAVALVIAHYVKIPTVDTAILSEATAIANQSAPTPVHVVPIPVKPSRIETPQASVEAAEAEAMPAAPVPTGPTVASTPTTPVAMATLAAPPAPAAPVPAGPTVASTPTTPVATATLAPPPVPAAPVPAEPIVVASTRTEAVAAPTPLAAVQPVASPPALPAQADVRPAPAAPVSEPRALPSYTRDEIASLLKRSQDLIAAGDISSGRLLLTHLAEAGSAEACRKLAGTYDAAVLANLGVVGVRPDPVKARAWYSKATELESSEAKQRLQQSAAH